MRILSAVLLAATAACGGRTQIPIGPAEAGAPATDASGPASTVEPGSPCTGDVDCAVTAFCVTSATCGPTNRCVLVPRSCDDGVACTEDACSEPDRRCTHTPSDSLCPATQLCSATRGCDAFVYAVASDGHIYEVRVPSGELVDVGMPAAGISQLALGLNAVLYGTDNYVLSSVDRATARTTPIASIVPLHSYSGLGTLDGGLLATADVPQVFAIDAVDGSATAVASLPSGYRASGDVTALGVRAFVSVASTGNPSTATLVEVNTATGGSTIVGDLGYPCVWGLATLGDVVYGLTCHGQILTIDTTTGTATQVINVVPAFLGAAGR